MSVGTVEPIWPNADFWRMQLPVTHGLVTSCSRRVDREPGTYIQWLVPGLLFQHTTIDQGGERSYGIHGDDRAADPPTC
jgi:hypothetical protein